MTDQNEALAVNRAIWDEKAGINYRSAMYDVDGFRAGAVRLPAYEIEEVGDVAGKDLLHLQCHFGIDTLSWGRLGARVTGVDFSERAIAYARALSSELGEPASFVCCDVLDLPAHLEGEFDVVYTSHGVLGWLPDLDRWARVIAHFLPAGRDLLHHGATPVRLAVRRQRRRDRPARALPLLRPWDAPAVPGPGLVRRSRGPGRAHRRVLLAARHRRDRHGPRVEPGCASTSSTSGRSSSGRCRSWWSTPTAPGGSRPA